MNEPITWLMAVKNGMPYVGLTLESIANQTYRNHSIAVWDNGSSDGTVQELGRWIPDRIPGFIVTDRPLSLGASRAGLLRAAKTELCALTDSDDIHLPQRIEKQVAHMLAHPEVVGLGTQVKLIDAQNRPLPGGWICPTEDAESRWRTRWRCSLHQPCVMLRRSAALRAGNYADLTKAEDFELWIRLCPFGEMYSLPDELLLYRRHDASFTGAMFPEHLRGVPDNTTDLFPNLSGEEALSLWRVANPLNLLPREGVSIWHVRQLARAARSLAQRCGKPADYFQKTPTYQEQHYWLRRNALRSMGLESVSNVSRRVHTHAKRWIDPQRLAG